MAKEIPSDINLDTYGVYDIEKFLKQVVLKDTQQFREDRLQRKNQINEVLTLVWGEETKKPFFISPSTAARCLKIVGFEALGYKPAPAIFKRELQYIIGTGAHWMLLKKLSPYGLHEHTFQTDIPGVSGRMDFLFQNPITEKWQVIDLKFVGSFVFKTITREGLTPELKINKKNCNPSPEAKKQILLYMWAQDQVGLDIACGNVIYINRDSGEMKQCIIPWGAREKFDINQFIEKIKIAKEAINKGELPQASVESPYICKSPCPHLVDCDDGKIIAGGKFRKESKRRPKWVYKKVKEEKKEYEIKMQNLGITQARLIPEELFENDFESTISRNIQEATGGLALPRIGKDLYKSQKAGEMQGQGITKLQKEIKQEKTIYIRGDIELQDKTCKCGKNLIQSVRLVKTYKNGKYLLSIDEQCPRDGLIKHYEPVVDHDQYIG
ncbi:MAG TPA: hypothetical protein VJ399_02925 [Patescibacteria group bacterium]|nr:hypothetical protein [Patescibacteria group bacterium]